MAELKIIGMDEVAVEEIEWLWYPYIGNRMAVVSVHSLREAYNHTRRPRRRQNDFDFTACSIVVTGR